MSECERTFKLCILGARHDRLAAFAYRTHSDYTAVIIMDAENSLLPVNSVDYLREHPFLQIGDEALKVKIKALGRDTLEIGIVQAGTRNSKSNRSFNPAWFQRADWLTAETISHFRNDR